MDIWRQSKDASSVSDGSSGGGENDAPEGLVGEPRVKTTGERAVSNHFL
jgi:hypothetical protein